MADQAKAHSMRTRLGMRNGIFNVQQTTLLRQLLLIKICLYEFIIHLQVFIKRYNFG